MEIHPIVWNVKDKSYHDKDKSKEVMQEIAEKLDLPGTHGIFFYELICTLICVFLFLLLCNIFKILLVLSGKCIKTC
jgi:hypothetical protein